MAKRSSKKENPDFSVTAHRVVQKAIGEADDATPELEQAEQWVTEGKNPAAVALGRLGDKRGGKTRAAKLTPEQRSESAWRAAQARWAERSH